MAKLNISEEIPKFLLILIGSLLYVIGINFFIVTSGIFSTGLMGLAQEFAETINQLFNMEWLSTDKAYLLVQTLAYWFMNLPAIILGFKKVGFKFTFKTLITSFIIIPLLLNTLVIDQTLVLDTNGQLTLASQILSAILGGTLTGVGMGIIFQNGASSGGTDIIATYLALFKGKSFGVYNLMINAVVMIWAFLLYRDIEVIILLLILIYVQSIFIDKTYNFHEKKTLFIVTQEVDAVHDILIEQNRTYTKLDGHGGYKHGQFDILLVVINKDEQAHLFERINEVDSSCFITSLETYAVNGHFQNNYIKNL